MSSFVHHNLQVIYYNAKIVQYAFKNILSNVHLLQSEKQLLNLELSDNICHCPFQVEKAKLFSDIICHRTCISYSVDKINIISILIERIHASYQSQPSLALDNISTLNTGGVGSSCLQVKKTDDTSNDKKMYAFVEGITSSGIYDKRLLSLNTVPHSKS